MKTSIKNLNLNEEQLEKGEDTWKCPHCGSDEGTWFSRTMPMSNVCYACNEDVD